MTNLHHKEIFEDFYYLLLFVESKAKKIFEIYLIENDFVTEFNTRIFFYCNGTRF